MIVSPSTATASAAAGDAGSIVSTAPCRTNGPRRLPQSPGPLAALMGELERPSRRGVDGRMPVVPLDAVPGAGVLVENLLHGAVACGTLSRLGLRHNAISNLEGHPFSFPCCRLRAYPVRRSFSLGEQSL